MINSTKLFLPNSVALIEDLSGGEVPVSMSHALIAATESCIAVGGKSESDGETAINLGDVDSVNTGEQPVFEGVLKTPSRKVVVRTVTGDTLLSMPVPSTETNIKIWANDSIEPDCISVGII